MENKTLAEAIEPARAPYTNTLIANYGLASNYFAVAHPSLPNYLALTSGSTWGITDDRYHRLGASGIGEAMNRAGVSWRAYMEDMTRGCTDSPGPYALKHNPFAYYGGACPSNVVALSDLDADLAGNTPRYIWITPNLCHDTHDCPVRVGDTWLATWVPKIIATPSWRSGGILFIVWDEDDGGDNHVAAIVVAPNLTRHRSARRYDHYSLLATIEDRLGVPRLGQSRSAESMTDFFG
jgi:acid phosphatase